MKRTLVSLTTKLSEHSDGSLRGGYAAIKGGAPLFLRATTNGDDGKACSGTNNNPDGCTNSYNCTQSTNSAPARCSNTGVCFH